MNDIDLALIVSAILSILLSFIQITADSKIYTLKSILTSAFLFYVLIMIVGNVLTTLLASSIINNYISSNSVSPPGEKPGLLLQGPLWIWYSLFGVFGFEALIQKINITFFDKGVLSINDWLTKAINSSTAASLEKYADMAIENIQKLAHQLIKKLSKEEIHTFASTQLGLVRYNAAINSIKNNPNINQELFLAHLLAEEVPKVVKAEIKAK